MKPRNAATSFSPNPRRPKPEYRGLSLRTEMIRKKTYELERLADRARGDGSRARINEAAQKAEKFLSDVLKSEGRFINAREAHEDTAAMHMGGLDVIV